MADCALAGLRVLDSATLLAAPLISAIMADHGADVVRLEPPGGDPYRSQAPDLWVAIGRRKRSLVLDLDSPEGRADLHRLIPGVDVVIVNEPVKRLQRRGLDHATLAALNPDLIYVHVTGFGLDGPAADRPGNGTIAEAFAGLTFMTGQAEGPPMLSSVPLGDAVTAYVGAFGIMVAWYQKVRNGGGGQLIDVNPVDAMLHIVAPVLARAQVPEPRRDGGRMPHAALRNVFCCSDGRWLAVSVSTPRQADAVRRLVGAQPAQQFEERFAQWVSEFPRDEAVSLLVGLKVPVSPVNSVSEVLNDSHMRSRNCVQTLAPSDDLGGAFARVAAPAPRLISAIGAPSDRLPALGAHSEEVLRQWNSNRR